MVMKIENKKNLNFLKRGHKKILKLSFTFKLSRVNMANADNKKPLVYQILIQSNVKKPKNSTALLTFKRRYYIKRC